MSDHHDDLEPLSTGDILASHVADVQDLALDVLDIAARIEAGIDRSCRRGPAAELRFIATELADRLEDLERELGDRATP